MSSQVRPLFVAGPARGGTTLMSVILSSHPKIAVAPENNIIPYLIRQWRRPKLGRRRLARLREVVRSDAKLDALKLDMSEFLSRVDGYEPGVDVRMVCQDFFECYANQAGRMPKYVGQKKNFLEYPIGLRRLFPEAKIVGIFRDPRATSFSAARKISGASLIPAAAKWRRRALNATRLATRHPNSYFEVCYEQLVESPERVVQEICDFLEVPFDQAMLSYHERNRDYSQVLRGYEGLHELTAYAIQKDHIHAWREKMSRHEVAQVEYVCGREMQARGYKPDVRDIDALPLAVRLGIDAAVLRENLKKIAGRSS
jgi:hypothetical protein